MSANTAPGLREAASIARSRAKLIAKTTRGGSAAAIALNDLVIELERRAVRAQARADQGDLLTSPAAAPAQAAE